MISREEVLHIAKLARLKLTEKEIEKMQKDLSEILDYFNVLKKSPKVEIRGGPSSAIFELREDKERPESSEVIKKMIDDAPDKKDGYIKVKAVL